MPIDYNGVTLNNVTSFIFNPANLFALGEQGAWYDPSDFSTLFQDAAGTTPVTAAGQPVGRMLDKSGRGNHATQSTSNKPTLQTAAGLWYLDFDGSNDAMATASIDFTATDEMSVFAGVTKNSDATTGFLVELSTSVNSINGSFALIMPTGEAANSFNFAIRGTALVSNALANSFTAPITGVLTALADISSDINTTRKNGALVQTVNTDQGTGNFGNYPLYIGARGGTTLPFNGRLYSLIVLGRTATAGEITSTEQWVAGKTGVTI